jgi:hypothetical protein
MQCFAVKDLQARGSLSVQRQDEAYTAKCSIVDLHLCSKIPEVPVIMCVDRAIWLLLEIGCRVDCKNSRTCRKKDEVAPTWQCAVQKLRINPRVGVVSFTHRRDSRRTRLLFSLLSRHSPSSSEIHVSWLARRTFSRDLD